MVQITSVAKMPQANVDSEMEEGEIVDELDDLSDISSEEEFLLRQRLEVLEDYNNVLERSKKKRSSGVNQIRDLQSDLSEISAAEVDTKINGFNHALKVSKSIKQYSKPKRRKEPVYKTIEEAYVKRKREFRKKPNHAKRKPVKVVNESSDESEDEYRNKRKKLADAVKVHKSKTDSSSLSARLKKMLHGPEEFLSTETDFLNLHENDYGQNEMPVQLLPVNLEGSDVVDCGLIKTLTPKDSDKNELKSDAIELLSSDDDVKVITEDQPLVEPDINISVAKPQDKDSDEDLDFLRQQVLSTKSIKAKPQLEPETKIASDDEDSDTAELRLICLKSTILKRAIEIKQKQKRNKRLSQSQTTLEEDIFNDSIFFSKIDSDNNTDIETMDMDIGSDAEEKKENKDESRSKKTDDRLQENNQTSAITSTSSKQDELEEDEDLLRAKLLTSLSKNLPNLVNPEILNAIKNVKSTKAMETKKPNVPEKRFIIKLGESDSEGEHEATNNLTKMHMKLSEQTDFQQQLDLFLKSTRMQVENSKLPDVMKKQPTPKKPEKFVAKTVNNLPKPEQMEYKNLVRRMAELEKLKQLRQAQLNSATWPFKDKNATVDTNLEEKISISRKRIADESSKMLKLKEEATKLSQRYKIVATELHNVSTAITLNKKQQRAVQNCLTKIRQQHQSLIKSSSTCLHSKVNSHYNNFTTKVMATTTKVQKENNPKDEYKNPAAQKTVKISVVNDLKNDINTNQLSVHYNIANNKKVVKIPSSVTERLVQITETIDRKIMDKIETKNSLVKEGCENTVPHENRVGESNEEIKDKTTQGYNADDYKSPLDAFGDTSWESDPNAILCPYEVGGQCKDPDCKYLHTQTSEQ